MKYISKLFQPIIAYPKNAAVKTREATSKSQRLMVENGIVKPCVGHGLFSLLPLGLRSMNKLEALVDSKMQEIGAQKVALPVLVSNSLWIKTGRISEAGPELMRTRDRHDKNFILGPTHEEAMTELVGSLSPISPKQLPLKLYQIGNKYRDEMRPRFGIMRSREFLMKDLYTFDMDKESSMNTYELVNDAYEQIFKMIGVDFIKVEGHSGSIGGSVSHEYHYLSEIGEDVLLECNSCNHRIAKELMINTKGYDPDKEMSCPKCGKEGLNTTLGIEVGHTFLLGTKYSKSLEAFSIASKLLHMGCYGLGLSRIIGAALEVLSSETELRWPALLAPYLICIIGPKVGSKEEASLGNQIEEIYTMLTTICPTLADDIIIDDRPQLTIGKKMMFAKRTGYPYVIVVGKKACQDIPEYEFFSLNDNESTVLNKHGLVEKVQEIIKELQTKTNVNYMENFSISNEDLNENTLK